MEEDEKAVEEVESEVTLRDVLVTMAMEEIQTGKVSVVDTLTVLGFSDVIEAARIACEIEDDTEDGEIVEEDDPDADDIEDPG